MLSVMLSVVKCICEYIYSHKYKDLLPPEVSGMENEQCTSLNTGPKSLAGAVSTMIVTVTEKLNGK